MEYSKSPDTRKFLYNNDNFKLVYSNIMYYIAAMLKHVINLAFPRGFRGFVRLGQMAVI